MSNADKKVIIIYLMDSMILSRNKYSDWKEIHDEYGEKYKTNPVPLTCDEIMNLFRRENDEMSTAPFICLKQLKRRNTG